LCLNSVGATAATTRNGTGFDTYLKKDLQAAHAYLFLLFNKEFLNMAKIGYFIPMQRREIQNPELLPTQVRFSIEQSTFYFCME
jgi:hypothetical protein